MRRRSRRGRARSPTPHPPDISGTELAHASSARDSARAGGEYGRAASTEPGERPAIDPIGSTLLVELDLARPDWWVLLERAAGVGLPLDVRIVPAPEDEGEEGGGFDRVASSLVEVRVARVAAFAASGPAAHVSDAATVDGLRGALAKAGVDVPVVGGVRSHFTELNRGHRLLPGGLDGITFSTTPLFHSLDTPQLVEAIAIQRLVARQAVEIAAGAPVHIGPITLRPRFNNVATSDPSSPLEGPTDPRQHSPALAAWTIASAAALAVPGVSSLSFFEEWGPRGIHMSSGEPAPAAAAVAALAALGDEGRRLGGLSLAGDSPDGLVWAIGLRSTSSTTVLVANLDDRDRTVRVTHPGGELTVSLARLSFVVRHA